MSVLFWFQDLPGPAALALICCYYGGFAVVFTWIWRSLTRRAGVAPVPPAVAPAISSIGTMCSILIGLVVVSLWNDYRVARSTVSAEATELRSTTRDVLFLSAPAYRETLLNDLRRYTEAVVQVEWPAMSRGGFSNTAGRALAQFTVDASGTRDSRVDLGPHVERIAQFRATRLSQTDSGIIDVVWFALLTIPLVLLIGIALLNDEQAALHYTVAGLVAIATSIAIFVCLEIDLPYHGIAVLSSAPIANAVEAAVNEGQPP